VRRLGPPFPNGPCGGTVVTLPPEDTYGIDATLNGNQLLLPPRQIDVWLPPDYSPQQLHPVLLTHDGQNSMADESSWTGASWRMIGALTRLADRQFLHSPTPIVVMLPSAEGTLIPGLRRRHLEYAADGPFAEDIQTLLSKQSNRWSIIDSVHHRINGMSLVPAWEDKHPCNCCCGTLDEVKEPVPCRRLRRRYGWMVFGCSSFSYVLLQGSPCRRRSAAGVRMVTMGKLQ
jgi:hypothetical protein